MSITERKAASEVTAPEIQGVAAKPQQTAPDESYRDGGPLQTRGPGNDTSTKKANDEHCRDGGPLQTREATTATSAKEDELQTNGSRLSPDDVERGV